MNLTSATFNYNDGRISTSSVFCAISGTLEVNNLGFVVGGVVMTCFGVARGKFVETDFSGAMLLINSANIQAR